jgi:hypothetical protein
MAEKKAAASLGDFSVKTLSVKRLYEKSIMEE